MTSRYVSYYVAAGIALLLGAPEINPDDPLEFQGKLDFERIEEEIPFVYKDDLDVNLNAELFVPTRFFPDALVLFMPGFGASYKEYEDYLEHFASHGFVAVGLDFFDGTGRFQADGEQDILANQAMNTILYLTGTYPEFADLPIFTAGHSLGGKIAFWVATLTPKISGVMALDPVNAGGGPCFFFPDDCQNDPVAPNNASLQEGIMTKISTAPGMGASSMIIRSAPDPLTNPDDQFNADNFFFGTDGQGLNAAPSPVWYYDFGRFPHALYVPELPTKQTQIIKRTMTAFLFQEVLGSDVEAYLTGEIIQDDIDDDLLLSVQTR